MALRLNLTSDGEIQSGAMCFDGSRIPFVSVWSFIYRGHSVEDISREYPSLTRDQIVAAFLLYAHADFFFEEMEAQDSAMYLGNKPPRQKHQPEDDDPEHDAAIHELPCCICVEWGLTQMSPTQQHHCIMGRHSYDRVSKTRRKAPSSMSIPLCEGHHQGLLDTSKIALHREPDAWREEYGEDTLWISWTEERLAKCNS